jgi:hypothetical protein
MKPTTLEVKHNDDGQTIKVRSGAGASFQFKDFSPDSETTVKFSSIDVHLYPTDVEVYAHRDGQITFVAVRLNDSDGEREDVTLYLSPSAARKLQAAFADVDLNDPEDAE